jgi:hypothetical protein
MTEYRGYTIEPIGKQFLIHTNDMYGYYYFNTMEAAMKWVRERHGNSAPMPERATQQPQSRTPYARRLKGG